MLQDGAGGIDKSRNELSSIPFFSLFYDISLRGERSKTGLPTSYVKLWVNSITSCSAQCYWANGAWQLVAMSGCVEFGHLAVKVGGWGLAPWDNVWMGGGWPLAVFMDGLLEGGWMEFGHWPQKKYG